MATCVVSGTIQDPSGAAVSGATVRANIITPIFVTTLHIVPTETSTTTDASGNWSLTLIQGLTCQITTQFPPNSTDSQRRYVYAVTVPATSTANFSTIATEL